MARTRKLSGEAIPVRPGTVADVAGVIGKLFERDALAPVVHPRLWARESTTGPDRLRTGFSALFEQDARAGLWIGETAGRGLLVLDEHDLVYAYGPLDAFGATLVSLGYGDGVIVLPDPHEHHYNAELDHLEAGIRATDCWNRLLSASDDESEIVPSKVAACGTGVDYQATGAP